MLTFDATFDEEDKDFFGHLRRFVGFELVIASAELNDFKAFLKRLYALGCSGQ